MLNKVEGKLAYKVDFDDSPRPTFIYIFKDNKTSIDPFYLSGWTGWREITLLLPYL